VTARKPDSINDTHIVDDLGEERREEVGKEESAEDIILTIITSKNRTGRHDTATEIPIAMSLVRMSMAHCTLNYSAIDLDYSIVTILSFKVQLQSSGQA